MQLGMLGEPLVPGMQRGFATDADSAPAEFGRDGAERLGCGPEQDVEHGLPDAAGGGGDLARQREDDVEGGNRRDAPGPGLHPLAGGALPDFPETGHR